VNKAVSGSSKDRPPYENSIEDRKERVLMALTCRNCFVFDQSEPLSLHVLALPSGIPDHLPALYSAPATPRFYFALSSDPSHPNTRIHPSFLLTLAGYRHSPHGQIRTYPTFTFRTKNFTSPTNRVLVLLMVPSAPCFPNSKF
jgi:hypothetical protein